MSGCGDVCIDMEVGEYNEFFSQRIYRARKEYKCCECRETIKPGTRYEYSAGKSMGMLFDERTCLTCKEVREAFVCGGYIFGELWETIEQAMYPIWETKGPIDCLAKIETAETRQALRDRYQQWRADNE